MKLNPHQQMHILRVFFIGAFFIFIALVVSLMLLNSYKALAEHEKQTHTSVEMYKSQVKETEIMEKILSNMSGVDSHVDEEMKSHVIETYLFISELREEGVDVYISE